LQMGDAGRPTLERLDFEEEKRLVVVEVQGKGVTFIPLERISCMDPMAPGEEKDYQLTSVERRQQIAVEKARRQALLKKGAELAKAEAARQRTMNLTSTDHGDAVKEAERVREEFKRQNPGETTPFPAGRTPPQYKTNAKLPNETLSSSKSEMAEKPLFGKKQEEEMENMSPLKREDQEYFDKHTGAKPPRYKVNLETGAVKEVEAEPPRKKRKYTKRKKKEITT
jgi:hypothetical protein